MQLILISLISALLSLSAWAGEWQNKPILCLEKQEILDKLKAENNEALDWNALQTTYLITEDGKLATDVIYIPVTMYSNKETGSYVIVEYHEQFARYCVLSQGSGLVSATE